MARYDALVRFEEDNEWADLFQKMKHRRRLRKSVTARKNSAKRLKNSTRLDPVNQKFSDLYIDVKIVNDDVIGRHVVAIRKIPAFMKIGEAK